jgi:hypothetical protein
VTVTCSTIKQETGSTQVVEQMESTRHGRAVLSDDKAKEIYCWKPAPNTKERDRAGHLARVFGVSIKTIRDIWVGRTWYRATFQLDPNKPVETDRLSKRPGRPKGVKDSKPRTRKLHEQRRKTPVLGHEESPENFVNSPATTIDQSVTSQEVASGTNESAMYEHEAAVESVSGYADGSFVDSLLVFPQTSNNHRKFSATAACPLSLQTKDIDPRPVVPCNNPRQSNVHNEETICSVPAQITELHQHPTCCWWMAETTDFLDDLTFDEFNSSSLEFV